MAYGDGTLNLSGNLNVAIGKPLDARCVIDKEEDLTKASTWVVSGANYAYEGIIVYCKDTHKTKQLKNSNDYSQAENWQEVGSGGGSGESDVWEDERTTLIAWDKIPAGTSLVGKTWQEIIEMQVYPFIEPAFSSFSVTGVSGTKEVGTEIAANPTVTWAISNVGNATADTVALKDQSNTSVFSGIGLSASPQSVTHEAWTKTSAGTSTWTISATSKSGATFSKTASITWQFRLYYGERTEATIDEAGIKALRVGNLSGNKAGNYVFEGGGYKYICVPQNLGKPTTFKDASNNLPIPMEDLGTVSVTNANSVTQNYYCFRTSNVLGGSVTIVVA